MSRKFALATVLVLTMVGAACISDSTDTATETTTPSVRAPITSAPAMSSTTAIVAEPVSLGPDCVTCHKDVHKNWATGAHAGGQDDVASELAEERAGETPEDVIHGGDPENCIACHAPTAAAAMSDVDALGLFFTTTAGAFSADTAATNDQEWPGVTCTACHEVSNDHPESTIPTTALFDATSASYMRVDGSNELCGQCHGTLKFPDTDHVTFDHWAMSTHSATQDAVAEELAGERAGETPDDVIHGDDPENCIACHGPSAVYANMGMSEAEALAYFFTTEDGTFSEATGPAHASEWENVGCVTCHDPTSPSPTSFLDSASAEHIAVADNSQLCGQCHGSLRFETDHLTYDAWSWSSHAVTQDAVAEELAGERAGETPADVIDGDDPENCIACHGPTAVLANGGMSEAEALAYFFTTDEGAFTDATASTHTSEWPNIGCVACHDPHEPTTPALFESSTAEYVPMADGSELCGQCHGSLRFDTNHLSYDVLAGNAGIGVDDFRTMPMTTCTSCHMYTSDVEDSNSSMYHGHTWSVFVEEEDGSVTSSCSQCHSSFDAAGAEEKIVEWQNSFEAVYASVAELVASTADAMTSVDDADLQAKLDEAEHNLALAEGDESGGFHNHDYLMALLNDARLRAEEILAAVGR